MQRLRHRLSYGRVLPKGPTRSPGQVKPQLVNLPSVRVPQAALAARRKLAHLPSSEAEQTQVRMVSAGACSGAVSPVCGALNLFQGFPAIFCVHLSSLSGSRPVLNHVRRALGGFIHSAGVASWSASCLSFRDNARFVIWKSRHHSGNGTARENISEFGFAAA